MKRIADLYLLILASFVRLAQTTSSNYSAVRAAAMVSTAEFANIITLSIAFAAIRDAWPSILDRGLIPLLIIFLAGMIANHIAIANNRQVRKWVDSETQKRGSRLGAALYFVGSWILLFGLLLVLR